VFLFHSSQSTFNRLTNGDRAFEDYGIWTYVLPDKASRLDGLRWLFARTALIDIKWDGAFYVVAKDTHTGAVVGAAKAAWIDPPSAGGSKADSLWANVSGGILAAPLVMGLSAFLRLKFIGDTNAAWHKEETAALAQGHWYIRNVVVDPPHQSKGIGSRLVKALIAECNTQRAGMPIYLDVRPISACSV